MSERVDCVEGRCFFGDWFSLFVSFRSSLECLDDGRDLSLFLSLFFKMEKSNWRFDLVAPFSSDAKYWLFGLLMESLPRLDLKSNPNLERSREPLVGEAERLLGAVWVETGLMGAMSSKSRKGARGGCNSWPFSGRRGVDGICFDGE